MLREGLKKITDEYAAAKREELRDHPLAYFIRSELPKALQAGIADFKSAEHIKVVGTKMPGNWPRNPWIGVLDTRITDTPQKGLYLVYLFSENMQNVYLALGIGVTKTMSQDQRRLLKYIQDNYPLPAEYNKGPLTAGSLAMSGYGAEYEAATVYYRAYNAANMPSEDSLIDDLRRGAELLGNLADKWPLEAVSASPVARPAETVMKSQMSVYNDSIVTKFADALSLANIKTTPTTVHRLISALLSKPFLLLTGLSGSGKTKLAHALAAWLSKADVTGSNVKNTTFLIVPVGADWTSREPLLGYPDALTLGDYSLPASGVLQFMLRAASNPSNPYFLILDEMNLSHVERYFADILSTMESGMPMPLHERRTYNDKNWNGIPHELILPHNLFVIGTVNIDETTYMFSPKVLDRANVIEFSVTKSDIADFLEKPVAVDIGQIEGKGESFSIDFVVQATSKNSSLSELSSISEPVADTVRKALEDLFDVFASVGAEFGYRPAYEIARFIYYYAKVSDDDWILNDAVDAAVMQKLLPKLHGSKTKLSPVIEKLKTICEGRYPISSEKLTRMEQRLKQNGFTSYAEA
jgi:5-methylcytosine-specific restriction protein B